MDRVQITELQPDILLLAALLTAKIKEASLTLIPTFGITTILPLPRLMRSWPLACALPWLQTWHKSVNCPMGGSSQVDNAQSRAPRIQTNIRDSAPASVLLLRGSSLCVARNRRPDLFPA